MTQHSLIGHATQHSLIGCVTQHSLTGCMTQHSLTGRMTQQNFIGHMMTQQSYTGRMTQQSYTGRMTQQSLIGPVTQQSLNLIGHMTQQNFISRMTQQSYIGRMTQQSVNLIGHMTQHNFIDHTTQQTFIGHTTQQTFIGLMTQQSFIGHVTQTQQNLSVAKPLVSVPEVLNKFPMLCTVAMPPLLCLEANLLTLYEYPMLTCPTPLPLSILYNYAQKIWFKLISSPLLEFYIRTIFVLRPAIFIFFMDYFLDSYTVCIPSIQNTVTSEQHCYAYPEHSRVPPFLIYGYTDSIAQLSAVTQVLYEYNSLTQFTRQYV
jgi:hypothetical protein